MATFPSVDWFRTLAERMRAQPEKYRRLGGLDFTLVPRIVFPDGRREVYSLEFRGQQCTAVERPPDENAVCGPHPVVMEGEYAHWREMVENIRAHGGADRQHTLNSLTLPDWPFRLAPLDPEGGQLDVDRFYRYNDSLQEFFNEAARVETEFAS